MHYACCISLVFYLVNVGLASEESSEEEEEEEEDGQARAEEEVCDH